MLDRLPHVCPVCAYHEWNLDGLVEMAWEYLDLIRVYTKPKARVACTPAFSCRSQLQGHWHAASRSGEHLPHLLCAIRISDPLTLCTGTSTRL